jgi:hypothetical protein
MKKKKTLYLSIDDLKKLGILPSSKTQKQKRKRKAKRRGKMKDDYNFGGVKSSSDHMRGYGSTISNKSNTFNNTSNLQSELIRSQVDSNELENRKKQLAIANGFANAIDQAKPDDPLENNSKKLLEYVGSLETDLNDFKNRTQNAGNYVLKYILDKEQEANDANQTKTYGFDLNDTAGDFATNYGPAIDEGSPIAEVRYDDINATPSSYAELYPSTEDFSQVSPMQQTSKLEDVVDPTPTPDDNPLQTPINEEPLTPIAPIKENKASLTPEEIAKKLEFNRKRGGQSRLDKLKYEYVHTYNGSDGNVLQYDNVSDVQDAIDEIIANRSKNKKSKSKKSK